MAIASACDHFSTDAMSGVQHGLSKVINTFRQMLHNKIPKIDYKNHSVSCLQVVKIILKIVSC